MKLKPHIAGFFLVSMLFALYWNSDKILESIGSYKAFQEQNQLRNSADYQAAYDEMLARLITFGVPDTFLIELNRQHSTDLKTMVLNEHFGYFDNFVPTFDVDSSGAKALGAQAAMDFYYGEKYAGDLLMQADSMTQALDSMYQFKAIQQRLITHFQEALSKDTVNHTLQISTHNFTDLPLRFWFEASQGQSTFQPIELENVIQFQTRDNTPFPEGRLLVFWDTAAMNFPYPQWPIHWEIIP